MSNTPRKLLLGSFFALLTALANCGGTSTSGGAGGAGGSGGGSCQAPACSGCASCFESCTCGGTPANECVARCAGIPGCSTAPDCNGCTRCFDSCLCQNGDAQSCLNQCAATGGSGGVGGSTGGAGSVGGAGGSVGGSGGVSGTTGGVGGSGGGVGGTGGGTGMCQQLQTGSQACDSCLHNSCCQEIEDCFFNVPACGQLVQCLQNFCASAQDINQCANSNCSQYFNGVDAYNAFGQCVANACSGSC